MGVYDNYVHIIEEEKEGRNYVSCYREKKSAPGTLPHSGWAVKELVIIYLGKILVTQGNETVSYLMYL
jgi:hypothetical protein